MQTILHKDDYITFLAALREKLAIGWNVVPGTLIIDSEHSRYVVVLEES